MTVEAALPRDLPAAIALLETADLPTTGVAEAFRDFVVVREGGRLVGLCGLEVHGTDGLLRSLVVDPQARSTGVGSRLVDAVVELARARSLRDLYLLTTTAHDYFARRSFEDVSRESAPEAVKASWEFKQGCPSTSTFMRRRLQTP